MNYCVIISAYNEEAHLGQLLDSLINQHLLPRKIVIVNDNSTDQTEIIATRYVQRYPFIYLVNHISEAQHQPGSKVIQAFYEGFKTLDEDYDFIVKLDADLILPIEYFDIISQHFVRNPQLGLVGGQAYIYVNGIWKLENLTNNDHVRGAFKAYRKECFISIGGLQTQMGWDTADELIARYHNFEVLVDPSLKVKHLKPTGQQYTRKSNQAQGAVFYKLNYGFILSILASAKLAFQKNNFLLFWDYILGYTQAFINKQPFMLTPEQARFARAYRWKQIKKRLLGN